ncbi:MAG TPA: heavy metal-binding domain-containing protein [Acidimicrobiales bacterium]|nr:heavy metal-binding domain-containing protein [Acidimicrobiales bacterium]
MPADDDATTGDAMTDEQPDITAITQFPITTALTFPDWPVQRHLGMVFGVIVRSMGMARGIGAGLKSLAGGEVKQYTRLVEDSRRHALDRMIENATLLGANGIVSMRFDSSEVGQSLTEIVAYGTAVVLKTAG